MVGKDKTEMIRILNKLDKEFKITFNTGEDDSLIYVGMEINSRPDGISVHQSKYVDKILKRYNYTDINSASTPIERGMVTNSENFLNDEPLSESYPYREIVGSLLYLATVSRPDISFSVNYLSRFNHKPLLSHWKMVKRVLQYIKGTARYGILFDGNKKLIAFCDSDYGGDEVSRKSTSGVLLMRGGPVVWFTQKQPLVANSTAEAEYRAAVSAIDDISWIRRLAGELKQLNLDKPTPLFIDNQAAIHMLENAHEGKVTKGKKHIEISRKFIQQHIGTTVELKAIKSEEQLADVLTKPLTKGVFERLIRKIIKEE
ncbi:uncharacterized protein LOC111694398 [Trichogramma pretiosum]|uniref:uncharacterized protein LOC111694398 n=1 Tax=Trichogramma pretiosum TaxID=7493 RepID=UPI000C719A8C|nr:uncharacterized protein LOC111694398 [Trichogramma pretiosum]